MESCATCRFWYPLPGVPVDYPGGYCRRRAPGIATNNWQSAEWPLTINEDWCGEYAQIVAVQGTRSPAPADENHWKR